MWVQTSTPSYHEFDVVLGYDYGEKDFGNVKLVPGCGGLTIGFWSNKNGQAIITGYDRDYLNGLDLYEYKGTPDFTTNAQIKTYLLSATAMNMKFMLSAQLIATILNV